METIIVSTFPIAPLPQNCKWPVSGKTSMSTPNYGRMKPPMSIGAAPVLATVEQAMENPQDVEFHSLGDSTDQFIAQRGAPKHMTIDPDFY